MQKLKKLYNLKKLKDTEKAEFKRTKDKLIVNKYLCENFEIDGTDIQIQYCFSKKEYTIKRVSLIEEEEDKVEKGFNIEGVYHSQRDTILKIEEVLKKLGAEKCGYVEDVGAQKSMFS